MSIPGFALRLFKEKAALHSLIDATSFACECKKWAVFNLLLQ